MSSNRKLASNFYRVQGRYQSLAQFVIPNGNQESLTGDGESISNECYHTKIYSVDGDLNLNLGNGLQDGQTKLITFVHKGSESQIITVTVPSLQGAFSSIVFSNISDQAQLMWTGGSWVILVTLNNCNPELMTPLVK